MERTSSATNSHRRAAYLFALIVLIADVSGMALAQEPAADEEVGFTDPILIDSLPPLMCDEELCLRPTRMIDRGDRASSEDSMWWLAYGPDLDWNGMDDRLQRVISGQESISPTSIIGDDGRKTVAIVVDYAWRPQAEELEDLERVLESHGWIGEDRGAWYQVLDSLDAVVLDKVPVSALMDIYHLQGVVVIEMQNVMVPFNGVASKAAKSMPSDTYSNSTYERGYNGVGVVVAVLDTGVDNEHRALNDFDDLGDEPDGDATSYDDQKWVAGFDATSASSNNDGTDDPDDGQGHGTHVAATAIGTGGSNREHTGTGMGAYLVDIKVLTDSGGTNSQASISGMQWMINNKDTDWPGNGSAKGIDVASMSFGSVSSPLNPDDDGDNGSGAEARLVNTATTNGIACIVAMGNDGNQRVPSPASADGAISIGSVDDRNSVNRTNDVLADYSNYGPRLDDGDDDDWDELKPDITAFGSNIISASAAIGTSIPGQPDRPLADNEYDSKSGTSMATPVVSGIVAAMLQADSELTPEEIKDILRNSSESRSQPGEPIASEPSVSDRWNDKWGFGLVDAACALDFVLGADECGGEVTDENLIVDMGINFTGPSLGTKLSGLVEFTGMVEGTEAERIEFKIDRGDWTFGTDVANEDGESVNWYFNWDSTASDDGQVDIKIRALNASGLKSNISMRSYIVDNIPPSPDFSFTGAPVVFDDGLQVNSALEGSILEIRFEIRNSGDLDANDIYVRLDGPGEDSATYPSFDDITSLAKGESVQTTLYWWATEAGSHEVSVLIDPSDAQNDPKPEDNTYTFSFQIDERPVEPMLRFLPGSARLNPVIPTPDAPFDINIRVDNLGETQATNLKVSLAKQDYETGLYVAIDSPNDVTLTLVPGSETGSGS
ncbi:MAG: S8 family serine peptidase, partial [Euryarchaeota archaeon]|nr:S8 family serine peptidase [Euryarchaeota archaeon]